MKNIISAIVVFFVVLFAYTKLAGPFPFTISSTTTTKTDSFSVTGEGKVYVVPDIVVISAGVQAQGNSVKTAQDQLNKAINAVSGAVKAAGVDNKDIQTAGYTITPMYDYAARAARITGYQASSNLTVKVRKIDTVNAVIDAATGAGANQIGGITFDVDDKIKAQNEAREKAVAEAKSKAENAAKIAGFTLGNIINYSEDFGDQPRPIMMAAKEESLDAGVSTQIETGSNEITVTVMLTYQIQ